MLFTDRNSSRPYDNTTPHLLPYDFNPGTDWPFERWPPKELHSPHLFGALAERTFALNICTHRFISFLRTHSKPPLSSCPPTTLHTSAPCREDQELKAMWRTAGCVVSLQIPDKLCFRCQGHAQEHLHCELQPDLIWDWSELVVFLKIPSYSATAAASTASVTYAWVSQLISPAHRARMKTEGMIVLFFSASRQDGRTITLCFSNDFFGGFFFGKWSVDFFHQMYYVYCAGMQWCIQE